MGTRFLVALLALLLPSAAAAQSVCGSTAITAAQMPSGGLVGGVGGITEHPCWPTPLTVGDGLSLSTDTLSALWNAGSVTSLGSGLSLIGGTLSSAVSPGGSSGYLQTNNGSGGFGGLGIGAGLVSGGGSLAVNIGTSGATIPLLNTPNTWSAEQTLPLVAIGGGTIDNTAIGSTTPAAGAFTLLSAIGQITSTLSNGTAPFVVASSTNVPNLNASSLNGATFASPGPIGSTTPGAVTATTLTLTTSQSAAQFLASPAGSSGAPSFRSLASSDVTGALGFTPQTNALAAADLLVGNGSGVAAAVSPSGDVAMTNAGVFSIGNLSHVTNGSLANSGLVNSGLTLGSTGLTLGGTVTSIAGLTLTSPTVSGGTINNAVIGGGTPAAATVTTLTASGAASFTAAGTGLAVTNSATFGTGSTNGIQINGGSGNPQIFVTGSGNGSLKLDALTHGQIVLGTTGAGNIFELFDSGGSNTDTLTLAQPSSLTNPFVLASTQSTTGGWNFQLPVEFNRNITYSGVYSTAQNEWPFDASSTISGTSGNTGQYALSEVARNYSGFQSGEAVFGLNLWSVHAAGSNIRGDVPLFVNVSETGAPGSLTAWGSGQSITVIGTLRTNGGTLYQSTTTGTTGASAPTCGFASTCSDGTVTWLGDDLVANSMSTVVIAQQSNISYNAGGAAGAPIGANFGANFAASLLCPSTAPNCATYYNQNVGVEVDDMIASGASAYRDAAMQLVKTGGQGLAQDFGISFSASSNNNNWRNPIIFESAVDANGVAIEFANQSTGGLQPMAGVLDALMVQTTGSNTGSSVLVTGGGGYIERGPNQQILGTGDFQIGTAGFHVGSQTLTMDTTYSVLASVGATSGGTNWSTSMMAVDDYGNIGTITASAGVPSSVSLTCGLSACPKTYVLTSSVPGGSVTWHAISANGNGVTSTGTATYATNFTTASETYTAGTTLDFGTTSATTLNFGNSGSTITLAGTVTMPTSTTGAGTQTFVNSPCSGLTTEKWIPVHITGQTGTWNIPACQ